MKELDDQPVPPVALVDVDLPGMSGLDFVDRLERLRPGMMVVLITAVSGERIERFRRDHAVRYIQKPLDFPQLVEMLRCSDSPSETGRRGTNTNFA